MCWFCFLFFFIFGIYFWNFIDLHLVLVAPILHMISLISSIWSPFPFSVPAYDPVNKLHMIRWHKKWKAYNISSYSSCIGLFIDSLNILFLRKSKTKDGTRRQKIVTRELLWLIGTVELECIGHIIMGVKVHL